MAESIKYVHLFNFDKTYNLASVEALLLDTKAKVGFELSIEKHSDLVLGKMSESCESIIPVLQMDLAVFVVQAHESRLSINEDSAGIGYAKFYKALQHKTGEPYYNTIHNPYNRSKACIKRRATAVLSWFDCSSTAARHYHDLVSDVEFNSVE